MALESLGVRELLAEAKRRSIDCSGFVERDEIIALQHRDQQRWNTAGGTIDALERITDTWAATRDERQPLPVLVACVGLAADVECYMGWHTKLGSDEPVDECPQRKAAS
jgi:hypothetical protein